MKNDIVNDGRKPADDPIVIVDECGDTMWNAVLEQKVTACQVKENSKSLEAILNGTGLYMEPVAETK